MNRTGVLIVDDSAFMRKILSEILSGTDDFAVVDTAVNGLDALEKLAKHGDAIDMITLDIEMPKMDGLTCLKRIMADNPRKVVMVSSLTTEGARETIEALENGAVDFIAKPGGAISINFESVGPEFLKVVRGAMHAQLSSRPGMSRLKVATQRSQVQTPIVKSGLRKLVAIASSTGGPKSLAYLLPYLPKELNAAVVVVQHMPETFTKLLAERLDRLSKIKVKEAAEGDRLLNGLCLIAPGGYHLEITRSETVHLTKDPPVGGLRPCADITFRTIASVFGKRALAAVITGMGRDGTEGCKIMKQHGSPILAETEKTAFIYGMPRSIIENELHDLAVPIDKMAQAIVDQLDQM